MTKKTKNKTHDEYMELLYDDLNELSGKVREGVVELKLQIERQQNERWLAKLMLALIVIITILMAVVLVWMML